MSKLNAVLLMFEALRLEMRASAYVSNQASHTDISEAWQQADTAAKRAGEELERAEQEAATDGREAGSPSGPA